MGAESNRKHRLNFYWYSSTSLVIIILIIIDKFQLFNLPSPIRGISDGIDGNIGFVLFCSLFYGIIIGTSWAGGWKNNPDVKLKTDTQNAISQFKQKVFTGNSEFWKTIMVLASGILIYLFMTGRLIDLDYFTDFEDFSIFTCFFWLLLFAPITNSFTPKWMIKLGEWVEELENEEK